VVIRASDACKEDDYQQGYLDKSQDLVQVATCSTGKVM
jgi:hypothetical protein